MAVSPGATRTSATEKDLYDLPEDVIGQLVDGELIVLPRPDAPHTGTASDLGALLVTRFRFGTGGPGGWVILHEPKIRFSRGLLAPDLAGWKRERFVAPRKGPYVVRPDWICEVLSPSTVRIDRKRKLPIYAGDGVSHAWVVDPVARTLEVLRLHEGRRLIVGIHGDQDVVRAEPFDAVELELSAIWVELADDSAETAE